MTLVKSSGEMCAIIVSMLFQRDHSRRPGRRAYRKLAFNENTIRFIFYTVYRINDKIFVTYNDTATSPSPPTPVPRTCCKNTSLYNRSLAAAAAAAGIRGEEKNRNVRPTNFSSYDTVNTLWGESNIS